jgi:Ferredoxin subunits of nitrite reductase and ring-hydroxylating dioxygenases
VGEWLAVAELPVLARRKRMQVDVDGVPVALFLVGQDVYALADTCIHKQRSLSKGVLLNGCIVCPGHQWAFDPATGYEATQDRYQPSYDVRIEGRTVYVASAPRVTVSASTIPEGGAA